MSGLEKVLRRLRSLRKKRALTQDKLALSLGVSRSTYVRKEQGNIPVTTEEWLKLADFLGVEVSYFFTQENAAEVAEDSHGRALVSLYGFLTTHERRDLIRLIEIAFKGVKRKNVREQIVRLCDGQAE